MRYTRYDYRKKNGGGFFLWLILVIILALAIGMVFFKFFFNGKSIKNPLDLGNNPKEEMPIEAEGNTFKIIQCGLFSKEENAKATLTTLPGGLSGFVVEDEGKFKVMVGIYTDDNGSKKAEELTKASINNFAIKCVIPCKTTEEKVQAKVVEGYLQIINKIEENDVKSIKTSEFKKWTEETINKIENPSEELQALVKNIRELPEEYKRENVESSNEVLYNFIIKYRI